MSARPRGDRKTPPLKTAASSGPTTAGKEDYEDAVRAVRALGLDPAQIPHYKPPGV
jgi:hypothetical protein